MKYKINFKVTRENNSINSSGEGYIEAENFEEMAEEILRWINAGGKAEILGIEEL
jgi:hypothetical protein